jgi:Domain of unknown function DUF29
MAKVLERSLYTTYYYAWTKQQAAALRAMAAARVNTTLDGAPRRGGRELGAQRSRHRAQHLRRIVEYLLKLAYSPAAEPRFGWRESMIERAT